MSWTTNFRRGRSVLFSVTALGGAAISLWYGATLNNTSASNTLITQPAASRGLVAQPAATFTGANLGALPDAPTGQCWGAFVPTPRNVTFEVSGVAGPPTNVELSTTFSPNHSWVGDVRATLIAPNGASHIVFSRTGSTTSGGSGDSSNLAGPYNFKDSAAGVNWWTAAANEPTGSVPLPAGDYRTTTAGGVAGAGTNTSMTPSFAGVANPTGTWTLRLEDGCAGDTGSISAAALIITGGPVVAAKPNADFDGDGKSDFSIARDNTPPPIHGPANGFFRAESVREKLWIQHEMLASGELVPGPVGSTIQWWSNSSGGGATEIANFGTSATDFIVPNDYDGDGQADFAVWRPGAATDAAFYVLQSSNNTLLVTPFGQTGDDTAITGDYDGDLTADYASYRCPALGSGDGQCFFYFKGSFNNPMGNITYVPWGFGEQFDFFVNPGDFDGDGKFDFCIQRTDPTVAGAGQFVLRRSSDGGAEFINWGRNSDLIVPGDYDGDGKYDFCVSRTETINGVPGRSYYILERDGGGTGIHAIRWGIAGDVRTPGDFDGDGKTDIAIWRQNVDPTMNFYWVRRSSDGMVQVSEWGAMGDFAVPAWIVH